MRAANFFGSFKYVKCTPLLNQFSPLLKMASLVTQFFLASTMPKLASMMPVQTCLEPLKPQYLSIKSALVQFSIKSIAIDKIAA